VGIPFEKANNDDDDDVFMTGKNVVVPRPKDDGGAGVFGRAARCCSSSAGFVKPAKETWANAFFAAPLLLLWAAIAGIVNLLYRKKEEKKECQKKMLESCFHMSSNQLIHPYLSSYSDRSLTILRADMALGDARAKDPVGVVVDSSPSPPSMASNSSLESWDDSLVRFGMMNE
jgi:hypothetical protein